jgi:hypothetical protein
MRLVWSRKSYRNITWYRHISEYHAEQIYQVEEEITDLKDTPVGADLFAPTTLQINNPFINGIRP